MAHAPIDIPTQLLDRGRRIDFINWLVTIPVPITVKRSLARTWRTESGGTLSRTDYQIIEASRADA